MSDPIEEPTPPPSLPDSATEKNSLSYNFPNILLGIGVDANGFVAKQIREGESRQVEFTTVTSYADEPAEEKPFVIAGLNRVQFGRQTVHVINDAADLGKVVLPATSPTASEYLAMIGQDVLVGFLCRRDPWWSEKRGKPAYRIDRITIKLL